MLIIIQQNFLTLKLWKYRFLPSCHDSAFVGGEKLRLSRCFATPTMLAPTVGESCTCCLGTLTQRWRAIFSAFIIQCYKQHSSSGQYNFPSHKCSDVLCCLFYFFKAWVQMKGKLWRIMKWTFELCQINLGWTTWSVLWEVWESHQ